MENYESLGTIGEGTYGVVLKCRHKTTGQIVAIKKFKESDDDEQVKKTALREIKILKQLRHENIVSLLEVFRVKGKLYLVFEFVEKTILEEIERHPDGLDSATLKRLMWQLVRAIHFCHQHNIIHRDIKPENLLVSRNGVLKLCDFGFARPLASAGAKYTEYVSTRWYRAPELLVGDVSYGKAVDVWSIGCMFAEIATGLPLFPGDSDIDQLYHIIRCLGHITSRQQELFRKNALYVGVKLPKSSELEPLEARFPHMDKHWLDFLHQTILDEPLDRWTCAELLKHPFFEDSHDAFEAELQEAIARDLNDTAAIRKKRGRKPLRGAGSTGLTPVTPTTLPVTPSSYGDSLSGIAIGGVADTSKPLGKQLFTPMVASQPRKEKTSNSSSNGGHLAPRKTPPGIGLGAGITGGGYHLPTLQGAMANSSSTSSTTSSTATTTSTGSSTNGSTAGAAGAENNASSPHFGQKKNMIPSGSIVPPIAEYQQAAVTYGVPITPDSITYIGQHGNARLSITSHGGRLNGGNSNGGGMHPYTSFAVGPTPKPPPSSYMKNPYGAQQSTGKRSNSKTSGFVTSSLPSSMEIYSPKKNNGGKSSYQTGAGWTGAKKGAPTGNGAGASSGILARGMTPQGLYGPPRTSHSTIRTGNMPPAGHSYPHKARRDTDMRSY